MKIPILVSISKIYGGEEKEIKISFSDDNSSIEFASARMSLVKFAECITGLSHCEGIGEVRGLDKVGKKMEHDEIIFEMPDHTYENKKMIAKEAGNKALKEQRTRDSGWVISDSFNSQGSFFRKDNKEYARASIRRWVENSNTEEE